ncbi:calcium-activated chloride channel regulator 1 [Rhipicephalus sanguineus]|uniref:calcium-activated chloride channel regulator 1 n=1 Tax=Rhipicephalus sanguineus TaxID=34632 RepID=UPI0020C42965|nr:calcium-activated chloride channel regulator 1 [Rhipicephalus sanguineus]
MASSAIQAKERVRTTVTAPNKQNAICKKRSTWEVISENEDFKGLSRPDMSKHIEVSFEETQQREDLPQRVVLVLDVSGSMDDMNRLTFLKEAATRYIQDIADGSKRLAIVTFSTTGTVHHTMMPVNVNTRQGFLNAVKQLQTIGWTCIENETPSLKDVLPELMAAKVEVSTMALGASADSQIEKLATLSGGKAFFFEDLQGNTAVAMETAFVESTTTQAAADKDYIRLKDVEKTLTTKLEEQFMLEASLGNNTVVIVDQVSSTSTDISVTLIDPRGQKCKMCVEIGDKKTKKVIIPSPAQPGVWTIRVESSISQKAEVNIQVKSQGKDPNSEPIRVDCRMGSLQVGKPNEAIIYANVYKGKKIVLDATVVAEVTGPNPPHKSTVPLHDDGREPDIEANDGTYSGYFVQFTGKGRYTVTAHVSSDHRARVSDPKIGSGSFYSTTMFSLSSGKRRSCIH